MPRTSTTKTETTEGNSNAVILAPIGNPQSTAPPAIATAELTAADMIREFEDARQLALEKGQASAAVAATTAKAKLAGLLKPRPENKPMRTTGFDGNYAEAARRVALLLSLAANQTSDGSKR